MGQTGMAGRLGLVLGLAAAFLMAPVPGRADVKMVRLGVKGAT
jgi:hypothetical protein